MEHASGVGVMAMASNERRMQAVLKSRMATYRAELGRLDEAWEELSAASAELGADPQLTLYPARPRGPGSCRFEAIERQRVRLAELVFHIPLDDGRQTRRCSSIASS